MAKNSTAKPKAASAYKVVKHAATGRITARSTNVPADVKTAGRTAVQSAKKMDAGVIGYAKGSRFSDEEVRGAIRRVLSGS